MKKLTYSLAVLFSTATLNSYAGVNVCVPNYSGGFLIGVTGLYWRGSDTSFANGILFPGTSADFFGSGFLQHDRDRDYDWGYQINLGYVFPCSGTDVQLTYTHYDQDDTHGARDGTASGVVPGFIVGPVTLTDIIPAGGGVLDDVTPALPVDIFPAVAFGSFVDSVTLDSAKSDFRYYAVDLDLGQHVNVGCNFRVRWFGGLRYANFEKTFDESFSGSSSGVSETVGTDFVVIISEATGTIHTDVTATSTSTFTDAVRQKSELDGIGPRFGADADFNLGGGFGIVGGISTALLVAETNSSFNERLDIASATTFDIDATFTGSAVGATLVTTGADPFSGSTSTVVHNRRPDLDRIVPNMDAKLGLDFVYQFSNCAKSRLVVEAGYMVSHYWNTGEYFSRTENVAIPGFRDVTDISFDGPYVTLKVQV